MPGCVLRVSGDRFLPHEFLARSSFNACNVFLIGEPRGSGSVWSTSGFTVEVSAASGDELEQQVADAIVFLQRSRAELNRLTDVDDLEDVRLDFGVNRKSVFVQSSYFPQELLTLAGELKVGIEITIYGE